MTAGFILMEILRIALLMTLLHCLIGGSHKEVKHKEVMYLCVLICLCLPIKRFIASQPMIYFCFKIIIFTIFVKLYYGKPLLYGFRYILIISVLIDLLNTISAISAFPFIIAGAVKPHTAGSAIMIIIMRCVWYTLATILVVKKLGNFFQDISKGAQTGVVLISVLLEFAFLEFRSIRYDSGDILLYRVLLFVIIIGSLLLVLWLIDKREEQKRIRELTSYAHKTREVIPSVGRVLDRLEELSNHVEKSDQIISELRSICQSDMKKTSKEMSQIKTFDSTGSVVLDEQLEGYLEEAVENEFNLDIIVMAPVREILEEGQINCYQLLQLVGDLYRNAYKVILKRKEGGSILMCFGYNPEGSYEIAIYDNGEAFPRYVLEHLGKRGVTTDGTGHGLADIFEVLKGQRGSFILNQNLDQKSIFTKGISIIFDQKERREVNVR